MADLAPVMGVDPAVADVRREVAVGFGDTKYSVAEHSEATNRDVLTTGYHTQVKVDEAADKVQQRATDYFIAEQNRNFDIARDIADIKVQVALGTQKTTSDVALSQAQTGREIAESKYAVSRQIAEDGEKTRALINDLKNADLNRMLIERNSDINYYRNDCNRWEGLYGNGQFASLASQINALQSNLAETRQGLYNFGTMAGVGQSSTQNQVR